MDMMVGTWTKTNGGHDDGYGNGDCLFVYNEFIVSFNNSVYKKTKNMKKLKKTMVFSETAQPSFSYRDLV